MTLRDMDFDNVDDLKKDAPRLSAVGKGNPFTLPDKYFANLEAQINARVRLESIKHHDFVVPEGYFEDLTGKIERRVLIESVKGTNSDAGFAVPEGYFEGLEQRVMVALPTTKPVAKLRNLRTWMQYAAAACITIGVGTGVYLTNLNSKSDSAILASIPDEEIVNYLQMHTDASDIPAIVDNLGEKDNALPEIGQALTEDELDQYINTL